MVCLGRRKPTSTSKEDLAAGETTVCKQSRKTSVKNLNVVFIHGNPTSASSFKKLLL